jgi:hypothetical protein
MIRPGFLDPESRHDLIELTRDGSAAHRLARRANALVLLDDGMSCSFISKVLFLDDDTIRTWYQLYQQDGIEGLASFNVTAQVVGLREAVGRRTLQRNSGVAPLLKANRWPVVGGGP